MDAAQEAAAARDKLLDQQAESEAELRTLRAKSTRQAAAVAAAADAEERVIAAEAKCKAVHADLSSWQTQVWRLAFVSPVGDMWRRNVACLTWQCSAFCDLVIAKQ